MKKGILIIGKNESGKTFLSKHLASGCASEFIEFFQGRYNQMVNSSFPFNGCHIEAKIIIIDDVTSELTLDKFVKIISEQKGIVVERRGMESFTINPIIIINCDEKLRQKVIKKFDSKYSEFFQLIDTTNPLQLKFILDLKNQIARLV